MLNCVIFTLFTFLGVRKIGPKGDKIMYEMERKINEAVFPGLQGGPHDNTIAGMHLTHLELLSS